MDKRSINSIELLINKEYITIFERVLDDFFYKKSPYFPICLSKGFPQGKGEPDIKSVKTRYSINEVRVENKLHWGRPLARIHINFEKPDFSIKIIGEIGQEQGWDKIINITRKIIEKYTFYKGEVIYINNEELFEYSQSFIHRILDKQPGSVNNPSEVQAKSNDLENPIETIPRIKGPTINTQMRAKELKVIKDEHPEWNMDRVALEYNDLYSDHITADSVRHAYRAMGWEWKRGDRIR